MIKIQLVFFYNQYVSLHLIEHNEEEWFPFQRYKMCFCMESFNTDIVYYTTRMENNYILEIHDTQTHEYINWKLFIIINP